MAIAAPGTAIPTTPDAIFDSLEEVFPEPQIHIERRVQLEDAWCYAACAVMAIDHVTGSFVRQCEIAGFTKQNQNCCDSNPPNGCTNSGCQKHQIELIFAHFGVESAEVKAPIKFTEVRDEIEANPRRPIEVVIDWQGVQSSHSVLITGVDVAGEMVYVIDPWTGSNHNTGWLTYESLNDGFGYGNWDRTWRNLTILAQPNNN